MNLLRRLLGLDYRGPRMRAVGRGPLTTTYSDGSIVLDVTFPSAGAPEPYWTRPWRIGYWTRLRGLLYLIRAEVTLGAVIGFALGVAVGLAL